MSPLAVILLVGVICSFTSSISAREVADKASESAHIPNPVSIPFLQQQVSIDGSLDDQEWHGAKELELNFVTRPFPEQSPSVRTKAFAFENGTDLYVAFIAYDPNPDEIRAFMRDHDKGFGNDQVGVKIDPYNDGRLAYQFFVNPFGVQSDSIQNGMTGGESESWDGIWESSGRITEEGFVVEMKIPLRLMNFEETEGQKLWGFEFVRFRPRSVSYRFSNVPFDRDNSCALCQMGEAVGFAKAEQTNNLAVVPTIVLGKQQSRDPIAQTDWQDDSSFEPGVDVKWNVTPEITLSGTLNPDFSQVEADAGRLTLNNTFALSFGERRPFFVENADYFSTFKNLIYTRIINAPDYGAKVTGREDEHSFGVFVANDDTTNFLIPGNLGSRVARLDEKSLNFAGRYRYDYSDDLSLGMLSTIRHSDSYNNAVVSVDFRYRLNQNDSFKGQFTRTQTEYPEFLQSMFCSNGCQQKEDYSEIALRTEETDKFSGQSSHIFYDRNTEDYFIYANHRRVNAGFRADLGFISNIDSTKSVLGGGYFWRNQDSWWTQITVKGDWDITHNYNGELLEREIEAKASIEGAYQSKIEVEALKRSLVGQRHDPSSLAIDGNTSLFEEVSHAMFFKTSPSEVWSFDVFTRKGDRVDYANNRLGKQTFIKKALQLNLGIHFRLELQHRHSRLEADEQPLFSAHLYDLRSTYQFDPKQFLRLVVSYSDVDRNQDNYSFDVQQNSRDLGLQLLYSYKVNPLTKLFVGYSQDAFDNDDLNSLKANNRSVFMKLSYGWLPAI